MDFALSAVLVKGWGEEGRPVLIPRSGGRLGEGDLKGVSGTLDSDPWFKTMGRWWIPSPTSSSAQGTPLPCPVAVLCAWTHEVHRQGDLASPSSLDLNLDFRIALFFFKFQR